MIGDMIKLLFRKVCNVAHMLLVIRGKNVMMMRLPFKVITHRLLVMGENHVCM